MIKFSPEVLRFMFPLKTKGVVSNVIHQSFNYVPNIIKTYWETYNNTWKEVHQ